MQLLVKFEEAGIVNCVNEDITMTRSNTSMIAILWYGIVTMMMTVTAMTITMTMMTTMTIMTIMTTMTTMTMRIDKDSM